MAEEEIMYWQRRELSRNNKKKKKTVATKILNAITQCAGRRGSSAPPSRRMKITIRKRDLMHILEAVRDNGGQVHSLSFEQRLNLMRRRQLLRATSRMRGGEWRPMLQTIPEEEL